MNLRRHTLTGQSQDQDVVESNEYAVLQKPEHNTDKAAAVVGLGTDVGAFCGPNLTQLVLRGIHTAHGQPRHVKLRGARGGKDKQRKDVLVRRAASDQNQGNIGKPASTGR